ncbi:MAG: hypothetical protein HN403_14470 [Rhodospirillales bacterium]|jgi:CheY-like chemotaxis protein|nr:hypothetical protein [Rhodospirillales bacterium]
MTHLNFDTVHALVADPDPRAAAQMEAELREIGVINIRTIDSLEAVRSALRENFFDLFIAAAEWSEGNLGEMINAVRHGEMGPNPYLFILVTDEDVGSISARRASRNGAEALLPTPVNAATLGDTLRKACQARGLFVATSDYVGPDRRAAGHGESLIPLLEVPNSLRERAEGPFNDEKLAVDVFEMMTRINHEKLDRHSALVVLLTNRVGPDLLVGGVDEGVRVFFEQITWLAEDAIRRLGAPPGDPSIKACNALIGKIAELDGMRGTPSNSEVNELIQLAYDVKAQIAPDIENYAPRY